MTSARIKDFLVNFLIALVLAIPILLGLYFFRDKIKNILTPKPSVRISGVHATMKTEEAKYNSLFGEIKDKKEENKLLIENEGEEKWVEIDPEVILLNPSGGKGAKTFASIGFSEIQTGDKITVYDFEGEQGEVLKGGRTVIWRN